MEESEQLDDFDDFFYTPGRSIDDSAISAVKSEQGRDRKLTANQSAKKNNRNNSAEPTVDKSNVSSDHDAYSPDYSSDSVTDSDSETDTDSRKRKKKRSRSRSSSSRSGGSVSSDRSSVESKDSRSRSSRNNTTRSRSRSESTDSSGSRTATPDSTAQKRKTEGRSKRRDSYSTVSSTSTYSGRKERKRTASPRQASRRQAWGSEENSASKRQDRPKTAKRRSSDDKPARREESHRREFNGKTYADSDSDMTDVSPIASPRNGSVNGHGKELSDQKFSSVSKPPIYQAMPLEDSGTPTIQDPNALDLNILMKAVSELEKQKRVKSNTRRVMFEPLRARPVEKSNYTFSNDDTHRIEHENKRLLQQIMQQVHSSGRKQQSTKDLKVKQATLTTSAINRRREQQRIENENLAFLKRLQKVKPSRGLSRNEQLESYNTTVLHGIPIATLHPPGSGLRSGRQSSASSIAGSLGRTRSLTSIHSAATASSFGTASRQSSRAGSRPTSAKKSNRERPPWNDRW